MVESAKDRAPKIKAFITKHKAETGGHSLSVFSNRGHVTYACDCGIVATADDVVAGIVEGVTNA